MNCVFIAPCYTTAMQHLRLFIALEISPEAARSLRSSFHDLPLEHQLYRTTRLEQLHVTIKFLGETDLTLIPQCISALDAASKGMTAVQLEFTKGALRPQGRPRTVQMDVVPTPALADIFKRVEQAFAEAEIAHFEHRAFRPHMKMARLNAAPSTDDIRTIHDWSMPDLTAMADALTLFESTLEPTGAVYTPLHRISL